MTIDLLEIFKAALFFGVPLALAAVITAVLTRFDEDQENAASAGSRISSEERAGASADFTVKKMSRAHARKTDGAERPPAFDEEAESEQFVIPEDFSLAEFTDRDEPRQA